MTFPRMEQNIDANRDVGCLKTIKNTLFLKGNSFLYFIGLSKYFCLSALLSKTINWYKICYLNFKFGKIFEMCIKSSNDLITDVPSAFGLFPTEHFMSLREGSIVNMISTCCLLPAVVNVVSSLFTYKITFFLQIFK